MDGPVGVIAILNPEVKRGVGKKGPWTMVRVRLSNGKETNLFAPIDIGDAVEAYQNGEFTNYRKISAANNLPVIQETPADREARYTGTSPDNPQLDRIEKQLTLILEGINDLKGVGDGDEER